MTGPSTSPETDQPVYTQAQLDACVAQARADGIEEGRGDMEHLERQWRAEARRECAEELLSTRAEYRNHHIELYERLGGLAVRWSGSGRTPADEG